MYVESSIIVDDVGSALKVSLRGGSKTGADLDNCRDLLAGRAGPLLTTFEEADGVLPGGRGGAGRGLLHFVSFVLLL